MFMMASMEGLSNIQSFQSSGNLGPMLRLLLLCDGKLYLRHTPAAKSENKQ